MHICHITTNHTPNDDRIFYKEILALAERHDRISWVGPDRGHLPPTSSSVSFHQFPHASGIRGRFRNITRLIQLTTDLRPDIVHCHEPESLVAAVAVKRKTSCLVVYDSHELWPNHLAARFSAFWWPLVIWAVALVERHYLRKVDAGVAANSSAHAYLAQVIDPDMVVSVLNTPSSEIFPAPVDRRMNGEFMFCHDGFLTFDRGLVNMMTAFHRVANRHDHVKLKIVGDAFGEEKTWLTEFVTRHNLQDRVLVTGWLDYENVGKEIAGCDAGLICFERNPHSETLSPNKLFNYMYYGMPIIAPAFMQSIREVMIPYPCGVLTEDSGVDAIADAMEIMLKEGELRETWSRTASLASREHFQWSHMTEALHGLYEKLVARRS